MIAEVQEWIDKCNEGVERSEEIPEEGEVFAHSVAARLEAIADWIEDHELVTEAQKTAIQNMLDGIERWLERGR